MITKELFGNLYGTPVFKYTMKNASGISFSVINYGAAITNLFVPDSNGQPVNVVLGFNSLDEYVQETSAYIGSICGRFANRIANGRFMLQNKMIEVSKNLGRHTLHGGFKGFDKKIWDAEILTADEGIKMQYISKDGEEGFPGTLHTSVTFLMKGNALHIEFEATTDEPTVIGLTHHGYFNLNGNNNISALNQELYINADHYLETDTDLIPTGKLLPVRSTAFNFKTRRPINNHQSTSLLYDHSFVLNKTRKEHEHAATLFSNITGICMKVFTTHPVLHFYDGLHLKKTTTSSSAHSPAGAHSGICLEAQHYYDSPNQPSFPPSILLPGQTYRHKTIFEFSA